MPQHKLPLTMVPTQDGTIHEPGLEKLQGILRRRITPFIPADETLVSTQPRDILASLPQFAQTLA